MNQKINTARLQEQFGVKSNARLGEILGLSRKILERAGKGQAGKTSTGLLKVIEVFSDALTPGKRHECIDRIIKEKK